MAYITLSRSLLRHNFEYLDNLMQSHAIKWGVVIKLLGGNALYLKEVADMGVKQICDSRIANIKALKMINPDIETIYIRPPATWFIPDIVRYADISLNTQLLTLKRLSAEAARQGLTHKVIIMVELGELREGVLRRNLISFYRKAMALPHIKIVGVGTNFSCMSGVLPNYDKLNQLVLYHDLIVAKFNRDIEYISGGSSVTIPLIFENSLPTEVNHFRVGETLFFGTDVYHDSLIEGMRQDVFKLYTQIIELEEKPMVPDGEMGTNMEGNTPQYNDKYKGKTSIKAILDVGLIDVEWEHIFPDDPSICCTGVSSDMLVADMGKNLNNYKIGDIVSFKMDYMGAFRLMHSKYIEKRVVD